MPRIGTDGPMERTPAKGGWILPFLGCSVVAGIAYPIGFRVPFPGLLGLFVSMLAAVWLSVVGSRSVSESIRPLFVVASLVVGVFLYYLVVSLIYVGLCPAWLCPP